MNIRADYLCYSVIGLIFLTSLNAFDLSGTGNSENTGSAENVSHKIVENFEGFRSCPYLDPVGVPTIGFGSTFYPDGRRVKLSDPCIDKNEARKLMHGEFARVGKKVDELVKVPLTKNQKTALTSLTFNIGVEGFRNSTLLRKLNRGDIDGAAQEFDRWVYGGGNKLPGLVDRREKEKDLFLSS